MITYLDPVHCKIENKKLIKPLLPLLSYDKEYWKQGQFSKKQTMYKASMIDKRNGLFLTGLLPKITDYLTKHKIPYTVNFDNLEVIKPTKKPYLKGITFRPDQIRLINAATNKQRGLLKSPTGTGKTILAMGFISCYPKKNILLLCHSLSILNQTKTEFIKFGFKNINFIVGETEKEINPGVTLASIQSFSSIDPNKYDTFFDIVIVDESHHVNNKKSQYGKVLMNILSPIKIGFTATLPEQKEKLLSLEGLIGPLIDEVTMKEGLDEKMLVKPVIKLIPVKANAITASLRKYNDIYKSGIVFNQHRNRQIIKIAMEKIRKEKTSLILVKEIEHGNNLIEIANNIKNIKDKIIFIQGSTENQTREQIRIALNKKEIKCVIATAIWREGVNIKTLDTIINACGGKSEIMVLQAIGRGLRTAEGKTEIEVYDFLDPYRYLAEHCIRRIAIYIENGWL